MGGGVSGIVFWLRRKNITMHIVAVVVVVGIDRHVAGHLRAKQSEIFGVAAYSLGMATTADMVVEAEHTVGGRHHHVKIMGHHEHATAVTYPHP
tara:strand:- start:13 stop:294 length:282 start_codon:yes stop_codon:yes gene_type:complete